MGYPLVLIATGRKMPSQEESYRAEFEEFGFDAVRSRMTAGGYSGVHKRAARVWLEEQQRAQERERDAEDRELARRNVVAAEQSATEARRSADEARRSRWISVAGLVIALAALCVSVAQCAGWPERPSQPPQSSE